MGVESSGKLNILAQQCHDDSIRWFGDMNVDNVVHHTLALAGEVGELANIVKKIDRGSLDFHSPKVRVQLASELTDVFIYVLNLAYLFRVDLEKSYVIVRTQNELRFSKERAARDERRDQKAE